MRVSDRSIGCCRVGGVAGGIFREQVGVVGREDWLAYEVGIC